MIHHCIVPSGKAVGELARFMGSDLAGKGFIEMHVTLRLCDATRSGARRLQKSKKRFG
jgi:hypothetical protein